MNYRKLLRDFFADRDGDWDEGRIFEATGPDLTTHFFELPALIELILAAPDSEQKEIWRVIQRLDVTNAPHSAFYDYFQFLADAYAQTSGMC